MNENRRDYLCFALTPFGLRSLFVQVAMAEGEGNRQHPRNLQGILQMAVEAGSASDGPAPSEPMSEEVNMCETAPCYTDCRFHPCTVKTFLFIYVLGSSAYMPSFPDLACSSGRCVRPRLYEKVELATAQRREIQAAASICKCG